MKAGNEYKDVLSGEFFDKTPKAVFAALAVSYAVRQYEDDFSKVEAELLREWKAPAVVIDVNRVSDAAIGQALDSLAVGESVVLRATYNP